MSELLVEMTAVIDPRDTPRVSRNGDEVEVRPMGTREVVLLLKTSDFARWYGQLGAALGASSSDGRAGDHDRPQP